MANSRKLKDDLHRIPETEAKVAARAARFKAKSWCEEYKWLRIAAGIISWVIQVLAIAAAFYGAKELAQKGFENSTVVVVVALVALIIFELLQRHSSDKLWDKYWSSYQWSAIWISVSLFLFGATTTVGIFGTYSSVTNLSDAPVLITNDSILNALKAEETILKEEIAGIENQTDHTGTIFYHIQPRYNAKLGERSTLSEKIMNRRQELEANNKQAMIRSAGDVDRDAKTLVLIFILLGFLFEGAMCFNSHYDFREECEDNEDNPEAFLKAIGIVELHPIIARKHPNIAAKIQRREVGFRMHKAAEHHQPTSAGFMKNYKPAKAQHAPPPSDISAPPPKPAAQVVEAATLVATAVDATTKPPVATKKTTEIIVITDPEEELKKLIKKLSPYKSHFNNEGRKTNRESDSRACNRIFEAAEKLDWENVGEELKKKWATKKHQIVSNPNFIKS